MDTNELQKLFSYVDEHFDSMIEELKEVCRFRSTADDMEGLKETKNYILKKWEQLGLKSRELPSKAEPPVLYGEAAGTSISAALPILPIPPATTNNTAPVNSTPAVPF